MSKLIVVMVLLAGPMAFASQVVTVQGASAPFGTLRPSQSDPYKKLFAPRNPMPPAIDQRDAARKSKVVCGMTIIPANPGIDPKMSVPRNNDGIDYKIRAIDPPICQVPK
jgi:hypothetical protein